MDSDWTNTIIGVVAVLAGGAWTALKASDLYKDLVATRYQWLIRISVAVVRMTYHAYVRERKQSAKTENPLAKISNEEAETARINARAALRQQIATMYGDKAPGVLGEVLKNDALADSYVEQAVAISKNPELFPQNK